MLKHCIPDRVFLSVRNISLDLHRDIPGLHHGEPWSTGLKPGHNGGDTVQDRVTPWLHRDDPGFKQCRHRDDTGNTTVYTATHGLI